MMQKTLVRQSVRVSFSDTLFAVLNYGILSLVLFIVAYPLYFILIASISNPDLVNTGQVLFYPKEISLEGYQRIYNYNDIWTGYANTIFYAAVGTCISIFLTMTLGYALSLNVFSGRKFIMVFITITMFFSGGLIPTFLLVINLGLHDTRAVMVLLGAVSVFYVIVTRTFIRSTLPHELQEAVFIDGGTHFRYFFQFVMPLSKALIAVLALIYGIGHWNDYFRALIYLRDRGKWPLQLFLRIILVLNQTGDTDMMVDIAAEQERLRLAELIKYGIIIVASAPVLFLYPFLQKYFVKGVMIGSLKG